MLIGLDSLKVWPFRNFFAFFRNVEIYQLSARVLKLISLKNWMKFTNFYFREKSFSFPRKRILFIYFVAFILFRVIFSFAIVNLKIFHSLSWGFLSQGSLGFLLVNVLLTEVLLVEALLVEIPTLADTFDLASKRGWKKPLKINFHFCILDYDNDNQFIHKEFNWVFTSQDKMYV